MALETMQSGLFDGGWVFVAAKVIYTRPATMHSYNTQYSAAVEAAGGEDGGRIGCGTVGGLG